MGDWVVGPTGVAAAGDDEQMLADAPIRYIVWNFDVLTALSMLSAATRARHSLYRSGAAGHYIRKRTSAAVHFRSLHNASSTQITSKMYTRHRNSSSGILECSQNHASMVVPLVQLMSMQLCKHGDSHCRIESVQNCDLHTTSISLPKSLWFNVLYCSGIALNVSLTRHGNEIEYGNRLTRNA